MPYSPLYVKPLPGEEVVVPEQPSADAANSTEATAEKSTGEQSPQAKVITGNAAAKSHEE